MKFLYNILTKASFLQVTLLLLMTCGYTTTIYAQSSNDIDRGISSRKMKARAKHAAKMNDPYTALFYYEEVVKKNPDDIEARFELAELYQITRNYAKAEEAYTIVVQKAPKQYPFAQYDLGIMQKMNGKYELAKENLTLFRKEVKNLGDKDFKQLLNKDITGCDSGITFKEFPSSIKIANAGKSVNQPHTEFSPVLIDTTHMVFGSLREDSVKYYDIREGQQQKQPVRQIFTANKENGQWVEKGKFSAINDTSMNMGKFAYGPFSGRLFFSKCDKDNMGKVTCQIYYIEKVKNKWSEPVVMPSPINIEGYTCTQPTIVADSSNKVEHLYFVSDRPKGRGGLDIWFSTYNTIKKIWSNPANFRLVNTSETESSPFYHVPSGTFYFSSNGHVSAGGLDVYKCTKQNGQFTFPRNMSFPINSPQDDIDFNLSADGTKGFVVSNRPGGTPFFHETCCDDIYTFEVVPEKPFECTVDITVVSPDTNCKGRVMTVTSYDQKNKTKTSEKVNIEGCNHKLALKPNHKYTFSVEKEGYQHDTLIINTGNVASNNLITKKIVLKPIEKEDKYEIIAEKPIEDKPFVLNDIQYETNVTELNDDGKTALDSVLIPFLKLHPNDRVFISAHTDNKGSHKYNLKLSNDRAQNVVKYLISKGINAHRLIGKGYGETKPIAPNETPDGKDNPLGRSLNRRTEFLLLKPGSHAPH